MVGKDWQAQPNAHAGLAFKEMLTKVLQTWRSILAPEDQGCRQTEPQSEA